MCATTSTNLEMFKSNPEVGYEKEMEVLTVLKYNSDENVCHKDEEKQNTSSSKYETKQYGRKINDNNNLIIPDGGWGWCILIGGFLTMILAPLPQIVYGILFSPLWKGFYATSTTIAWIFNTHIFIWNVTSLLAGSLCEEFGHRKIAFIGGVINSLSIILSGFAPSLNFLLLFFSVLGGIGGSLTITASIFIVPKYFLQRRGFAFGFMSLGTCCGSFINPILANLFLEYYGFSGACLIFGGVLLNQCVAATIYQPVNRHLTSFIGKKHKTDVETSDTFHASDSIFAGNVDTAHFQSKELRNKFSRKMSQISQSSLGLSEQSVIAFLSPQTKKETVTNNKSGSPRFIFAVRILKSTIESLHSLRLLRVIFIAVSAGCMMMGYVNFQMWMPFVILDAGHTLDMTAWCMSSAAISNAATRIVMSLLVDCSWFSVRKVYISGHFLTSASIAAFSLRTEFFYFLICATCWGFGIGMIISLYNISILNTVGEELFPSVFGVAAIFIALFFASIGPLLGIIRDATSNYMYILWIISFINLVAVPLWLMIPSAANYDKKRENIKYDAKSKN